MAQLVQLLGLPFLACLLMNGILGYLGIHVLKREVIFIDIALAQVAAVGAIAAHVAFGAHGESAAANACAFGSVLLAAAFYSVVRKRVAVISLEAVIGVTYAIAAAGALFLVGVAPGGHVHVHQMLAGSILWATWRDILWCLIVFGAVAVALVLMRKPLRRASEGYGGGHGTEARTAWWDFLFYGLLGVVITLAVRMAGVVVVFAFLIIPATVSALFAASWPRRLIIAWATGVAGSTAGLLFARYLDFSVGPSIALFLGIALVLAALVRRLRPAPPTAAPAARGAPPPPELPN